jgi:hypothetical protein
MAGKSLDDLKLSDHPFGDAEPIDPRGTDWYRFSQDITDLLSTGRYTFAETTLRDIQITVEKYKRVTDGQRRAVRNIEESGNRPQRGYSRRYEGYGR